MSYTIMALLLAGLFVVAIAAYRLGFRAGKRQGVSDYYNADNEEKAVMLSNLYK